jgi:putative DNA methylase
LDAVFTDPPYVGNVQHAELMDFCYLWLRGLVGSEAEGFDCESTRSRHELTGNLTQDRDKVTRVHHLGALSMAGQPTD